MYHNKTMVSITRLDEYVTLWSKIKETKRQVLSDGSKIGYAKKYLSEEPDIFEEIKRTERLVNIPSQSVLDKKISQNIEAVNNRRSVQYSEGNALNQEYLNLAKDPTANNAKLQPMVDEATKNAGYTYKGYHGTYATQH